MIYFGFVVLILLGVWTIMERCNEKIRRKIYRYQTILQQKPYVPD